MTRLLPNVTAVHASSDFDLSTRLSSYVLMFTDGSNITIYPMDDFLLNIEHYFVAVVNKDNWIEFATLEWHGMPEGTSTWDVMKQLNTALTTIPNKQYREVIWLGTELTVYDSTLWYRPGQVSKPLAKLLYCPEHNTAALSVREFHNLSVAGFCVIRDAFDNVDTAGWLDSVWPLDSSDPKLSRYPALYFELAGKIQYLSHDHIKAKAQLNLISQHISG